MMQATELGVWAIRPLATVRATRMGSARTSDDAQSGRRARMERIALAALKQSRRLYRPHILDQLQTAELAARVRDADFALLADPSGQPILSVLAEAWNVIGVCASPAIVFLSSASSLQTHLSPPQPRHDDRRSRSDANAVLQDQGGSSTSLALLVGPEGGFTDAEAAGLVAAGARPVSLGPSRLRTETAAVAMQAAVTLFAGMSSGRCGGG